MMTNARVQNVKRRTDAAYLTGEGGDGLDVHKNTEELNVQMLKETRLFTRILQ